MSAILTGPLVTEKQIYCILNGRAKLQVENGGLCATCVATHAIQDATKFFSSFLRKHLYQADVCKFVKDNYKEPLLFNHRCIDTFLHPLLENAAKIFLIQHSRNLSGRGEDTSQQCSQRRRVAPAFRALH